MSGENKPEDGKNDNQQPGTKNKKIFGKVRKIVDEIDEIYVELDKIYTNIKCKHPNLIETFTKLREAVSILLIFIILLVLEYLLIFNFKEFTFLANIPIIILIILAYIFLSAFIYKAFSQGERFIKLRETFSILLIFIILLVIEYLLIFNFKEFTFLASIPIMILMILDIFLSAFIYEAFSQRNPCCALKYLLLSYLPFITSLLVIRLIFNMLPNGTNSTICFINETLYCHIKIIIVIVASFLPPTMYCAFMSRNLFSVLDDFLNNLIKLGLLKISTQDNTKSPPSEKDNQKDDSSEKDKQDCKCEVNSEENKQKYEVDLKLRLYLERFEDLYGKLKEETIKEKVKLFDTGKSNCDRISYGIYEGISVPDSVLVTLSTIFVTIGWLLILFPLQNQQGVSIILQGSFTSLLPIGTPSVNSAFLGAYLFSIEILSRRYLSKDLRASAFAIVSKRILGAVTLTSVVSVILLEDPAVSSNFLIVLGFVIGFFPEVAWEYITKRLAPVVIPSLKKDLPLSDLDGLTLWDESRLEEEDIEDIPQMAKADIVDLILYTKIPPDEIIEWIDQAILYNCLATEEPGNSLKTKLQVKGIRTASSYLGNYSPDKLNFLCVKNKSIESVKDKSIESVKNSLYTYTNLELVMNWKKMETTYAKLKPKTEQPNDNKNESESNNAPEKPTPS